MKVIQKIMDLSRWAFGKKLKQLADKLQKEDNKDVKITITIKNTTWEYIQKKKKERSNKCLS